MYVRNVGWDILEIKIKEAVMFVISDEKQIKEVETCKLCILILMISCVHIYHVLYM